MKCSSCGFIEDRDFIAVGGYEFPERVEGFEAFIDDGSMKNKSYGIIIVKK